MKRRREIGPKKTKNRSALVKFVLWAVLAAVVGSGLSYLSYRLTLSENTRNSQNPAVDALKPAGQEQTGDTAGEKTAHAGENLSFFHYLFVFVVTATIISVLALLFFGVRAYQIGIKVRHTMGHKRTKIKKV